MSNEFKQGFSKASTTPDPTPEERALRLKVHGVLLGHQIATDAMLKLTQEEQSFLVREVMEALRAEREAGRREGQAERDTLYGLVEDAARATTMDEAWEVSERCYGLQEVRQAQP